MRQFSGLLLLAMLIIIFITTGCSSESTSSNIAYISANAGSKYEDTFKELNLGVLFDFNLKLPRADKSWVKVWVEGCNEGKAVKPFPLKQLSYGLSPQKTEEGHMGFGIINPNSNEPQLFLYSSGASVSPEKIRNSLLVKSGVSSWGYAIGREPVGIEPGEEKVLAIYRQGEGSLRADYNYQDIKSINEMISEDIAVLLLKIKVEEK